MKQMIGNTVLVCNARSVPWAAPGSPAECPKCKVVIFGIWVEAKNERKGDTELALQQ